MPVPVGPNSDVFPPNDADFDVFAQNFQDNWTPSTWGVTVPLQATITASADAYTAALATATNPLTRTPVKVAAKDAQRELTKIAIRDAIRKATAAYRGGYVTATEANMELLGLNAPKLTRTPISAPLFPPVLGIAGFNVGSTDLRITQVDQVTGLEVTNRSFAYGLTSVQLQRKIGAGDYEVVLTQKRAKLNVPTAGITMGTVLVFRCRYLTQRGLASPWSLTSTGVST